MRVALATENNSIDGRILLALAAKLGVACEPWETAQVPFRGWSDLVNQLPAYLQLSERVGIRHALVAIDNDGGAIRRPMHTAQHDEQLQAQDRDEGCATCLLHATLPPGWKRDTGRSVLVVPVQTLETWLHSLKDRDWDQLERQYNKNVLKRLFWGADRSAPAPSRCEIAIRFIEAPGALERLRQRESFVAFERQLDQWRARDPVATP